VHVVRKECVDRGELTSEKLRRDIVEPSSTEVQGAHRRNSVLSSERDRVTENSVELCKVCIEQEEHQEGEKNLFSRNPSI
jgi:hypothetical protein